jgi:hypothetical protein
MVNVYDYVPTTHTHIWLELNTKANKNEKEERERDGSEGRERSDFHFSSSEEGKWLVKTETREASTHTVGNKKQGREWGQKEESIYIYI